MPIEIREARKRSEMKKFVRFGNKLYEGNKYFCPQLEFDELNTLNPKKNPAFEFSEAICYLAYKDGEIVGRITGIVNRKANQNWNVKKTRFGWFDFIDDMEVSRALLDKVAEWGKSKGMDMLNGPVGFTDFDHQGLLLEGYEYNSPMISIYNYPYYAKHYENYGLTKESDWIEFRIFPPDSVPERLERIAKVVMDKYKLKVDKVRSAREIKKYKYEYFDVIDKAYMPLYNYSPLTEKQKKYYKDMFISLINFDFATIITNKKNEIVGFGVGIPSVSEALRKCKGKLFPFGFIHLLRAIKAKKFTDFDLCLIAVRPDYQGKGVNAIFFYDQIKYFNQYGVKYAETTSILEQNLKNQANWEHFEKIQHKRRRAYIKEI